MKCIVVDDEPIARAGIERLMKNIPELELLGSFGHAAAATEFMADHSVDLVFLDIQMPGINGLELAKQIKTATLIIFTTAFAEFALDSYEVDAVDYLVKPIAASRFEKAVKKAQTYHKLLLSEEGYSALKSGDEESIFIRSNRRYFKVILKDILFIEGLKDYVVIQMKEDKLITHTNLKNAHKLLPEHVFLRVNRSYIVNKEHIKSFSNNDVYIDDYEISIGNFFRDAFFEEMLGSQ